MSRKRKFLIAALVVAALGIATGLWALQRKGYIVGESTRTISDLPGDVTAELSDIDRSGATLTLYVTDTEFDYSIWVNDRRNVLVEKWVDGAWMELAETRLPLVRDDGQMRPFHLEEGENALEVTWEHQYGKLKPGEYRFIFELWYEGGYESIFAAIPFSITD